MVAIAVSLSDVADIKAALKSAIFAVKSKKPLTVLDWNELMPGLRQSIEMDLVSGLIFYLLLVLVVAFSILNTFLMVIFERTREFGMLLAIGMRPRSIMGMLQCEALFLWVIGAGVGTLLAAALIFSLQNVGIYLGEEMQEYAKQFYMPARLYPGFSSEVLTVAPLAMLVGTQLAALLPSLRIRLLRPVNALRTV